MHDLTDYDFGTFLFTIKKIATSVVVFEKFADNNFKSIYQYLTLDGNLNAKILTKVLNAGAGNAKRLMRWIFL